MKEQFGTVDKVKEVWAKILQDVLENVPINITFRTFRISIKKVRTKGRKMTKD